MKAKIGSQNYELQEVGTVKTDGGGKGTTQVLKAPQRRVVNQPCFAQITSVSWKPIPYVRNNFCSTAFGKLPLYFLSGNGDQNYSATFQFFGRSFVLEGWKQWLMNERIDFLRIKTWREGIHNF